MFSKINLQRYFKLRCLLHLHELASANEPNSLVNLRPAYLSSKLNKNNG